MKYSTLSGASAVTRSRRDLSCRVPAGSNRLTADIPLLRSLKPLEDDTQSADRGLAFLAVLLSVPYEVKREWVQHEELEVQQQQADIQHLGMGISRVLDDVRRSTDIRDHERSSVGSLDHVAGSYPSSARRRAPRRLKLASSRNGHRSVVC